MIRGLLHVIWCLFPLSCILQSVIAPLPSRMLEVTRPTTAQGHEELNPATTGSILDFINHSPTTYEHFLRDIQRSEMGPISGKMIETSSIADEQRYPKVKFLNENVNLVLGTQEEYIAQAIRTHSEQEDSQALADVIVELSTIRKRLTNQLGGYQEAIQNYLRQEQLPNVLNRLRDSLYGTIESLKYSTDEQRKNERIKILSKFFERELEDPEMQVQLTAQKARFDELRQMNPSTSTPSEEKANTVTDVVTGPLSETSGTSHEAEPPSNENNVLKWSNYQLAAELEYRHRLDHDSLPIERWSTLYVYIDQFLQRNQAKGWLENQAMDLLHPDRLTLDDYKLIEDIELKRREIIREAELKVMAGFSFSKSPTARNFDWRSTRTLALQTLVIESMSGPHSNEALGILQSLAHMKETTTPLTKRALAVAIQFQKKKKPQPSNFADIFSLDENIEPEPAPIGLLLEVLDIEDDSKSSITQPDQSLNEENQLSEHAKKAQDILRELTNERLLKRIQ